ncbi:MAG: hypothetical protein AAB588_00905 [Patescibacteria group bacterium]
MHDVLSLRQAVLATVHYFDLIDFAPSLFEVEEFLYGWSAPLDALEQAIKGMPEIETDGEFYFLTGRKELALQRHHQKRCAQKLWKKIRRWAFLPVLCPFVRMVAVVNSASLGKVTEKSDIDFLIVTKRGKLATTRFFMKVITQIFGLRAHHEKKAGRFCLSFFITEDALNLAPLAHSFDPHLAYFVRQAVPLYGAKTYEHFLRANDHWTIPYFKRPLKGRLSELKPRRLASLVRSLKEGFLYLMGNLLEKILYTFQKQKDERRRKNFPTSQGIIMNKNVFKFHENDPRADIAQKFEARLEGLSAA